MEKTIRCLCLCLPFPSVFHFTVQEVVPEDD